MSRGSASVRAFCCVIGDVRDFLDEGTLTSYFGIVPRIHESSEMESSGRIAKR